TTSTPFTVSAGAAATLSFTVQPSNATAGAAIAPAILVSAHDAFGNAVASFGGTVTMTIATNPSSGVLSGSSSVATSGGVATFTNLSIDKAGTGYALSASSGVLTGVMSAPFNIGPAAATSLSFTAQPTTATTNANISPAVKVTVHDALGNVATGFNGNITVAIGANPSGGGPAGGRAPAAPHAATTHPAARA